jgi:hypothetical protein
MIKNHIGIFQLTIELDPGSYDYKFIVDDRRWCYDILKPTKADERGNRNNVIIVDRGSGAPKVVRQAPKKEVQEEADPIQPDSGRKERQQKGQPQERQQKERQQKGQERQQKGRQQKGQPQERQQKERQPKGQPQKPLEIVKSPPDEKQIRAAVQKALIAVKNYNAPWFCADLEFDDDDVELPNILEAVKVFSLEIPDTACMFFASSIKCLIIAAIVPFSKTSDFPALEWVNLALSIVPGQPTGEGNDNLAHAIVLANPELGIFPIKLKDLSRGSVFPVLRKKGLIKDEEEDDDIPIGFDDI